jgi:hypothetical protein
MEVVSPLVNTRRGRSVGNNWTRGERNGQSKLTTADVKEIRRRYEEESISYKKLGSDYGICATVVGKIVVREAWGHVA